MRPRRNQASSTAMTQREAGLGPAARRPPGGLTAKAAAALCLLATTLVSTAAAPAPAASAAVYFGSTIAAGNNVRACADVTEPCRVLTTTTSTGRMQCWRDGGWATGRYSSNRWFLMELSNGQEGFVHSSFVTNQTSVPNCSSLARVLAADWALAQVKARAVYAPPEYGQGSMGGLDWRPGPDREWSGDCAKLPYLAYRRVGVNYPLNHAIGQWNDLASRRGSNAYLPRYGDPVFYSIGGFGHTGLYVGGQSIVATQAGDWAYKPVEIYPMFNNGYGTYLGWAKVS